MTNEEVTLALAASVGKTVMVTPSGDQGGEPELLLIVSADCEGFTYRILSDPPLCDPKTEHWWPYSDVALCGLFKFDRFCRQNTDGQLRFTLRSWR